MDEPVDPLDELPPLEEYDCEPPVLEYEPPEYDCCAWAAAAASAACAAASCSAFLLAASSSALRLASTESSTAFTALAILVSSFAAMARFSSSRVFASATLPSESPYRVSASSTALSSFDAFTLPTAAFRLLP